MVNKETSLIKIGFSKDPFYREKTLQSREPELLAGKLRVISKLNYIKNIKKKE